MEKSSVSDHLDYLFAGTVPDHPSRLLLHDRIRKLMEELKEQYDFIFMDCVPYSCLADARIVARLADATLYVMRHVGLVGRAECWATRTADGRDGVLLVIQTPQLVPAAARDEMQQARADSDYAPLAPMTNLGTLSSN